jgi:hypothetical protein
MLVGTDFLDRVNNLSGAPADSALARAARRGGIDRPRVAPVVRHVGSPRRARAKVVQNA